MLDQSKIKTDLGAEGNAAIVATFKKYQEKLQHCHLGGESKRRAIVTGFGLFWGASYNVSGVVASSMASQSFLPSEFPPGCAGPLRT